MADLADSLGDGLDEVIETYLEDSPLIIAEMRASLADTRWETLQRAAHTLKSSSGIFGAVEMIELCRNLEHEAGGSPVGKTVEQLEADVEAVAVAFKKVADVLNLVLKPSPESRANSED
jgi:HPt (histidine-containing phosphotransfer) domain-containing protein